MAKWTRHRRQLLRAGRYSVALTGDLTPHHVVLCGLAVSTGRILAGDEDGHHQRSHRVDRVVENGQLVGGPQEGKHVSQILTRQGHAARVGVTWELHADIVEGPGERPPHEL